jgi:hypothetical protein
MSFIKYYDFNLQLRLLHILQLYHIDVMLFESCKYS